MTATSWARLILIVAPLLAGCAWTMSSHRNRRISDCLAQCNAAQPQPGPGESSWGTRDQRTPCERKCHALK